MYRCLFMWPTPCLKISCLPFVSKITAQLLLPAPPTLPSTTLEPPPPPCPPAPLNCPWKNITCPPTPLEKAPTRWTLFSHCMPCRPMHTKCFILLLQFLAIWESFDVQCVGWEKKSSTEFRSWKNVCTSSLFWTIDPVATFNTRYTATFVFLQTFYGRSF